VDGGVAEWVPVVQLLDLREGMTEFDVGGERVLLSRDGDAVHACSAVCPHKFGPLAEGTPGPGSITCPIHEATFDLSSGRPFPGMEWAGNLPVFPVRVRDGVVEVQL
jgi:nitrite reductase/ring-hydroxylating ferredoxin subunit